MDGSVNDWIGRGLGGRWKLLVWMVIVHGDAEGWVPDQVVGGFAKARFDVWKRFTNCCWWWSCTMSC